MTVYKHFPGYHEARQVVLLQSMEDDLALIDDLYGRDALQFDGPAEIKAEALRQMEQDWRSHSLFGTGANN